MARKGKAKVPKAYTGESKPKIRSEKKIGRPSSFSQAMADRICEHLAEGKSLRSFCEATDAPNKSTVMRWLREHERFRDQYAHAREDQAEILADEILDISDDGTNDLTTRKRGDEEIEVVNHDHITRSRLRVDARKWFAGKLKPKKYGDKTVNEIQGKDGGPIEVESKGSEMDLARWIAFKLSTATEPSKQEA